MSEKKIILHSSVPESLSGQRLDQVLAHLFSDYSRAQLQNWIREGFVCVDGQVQNKTRFKSCTAQVIDIEAKLEPIDKWQAQNLPLTIVYEDNDLMVVNKPAGLVVHPGAGNPENTLVNALLHHNNELDHIPRAGLIHRLDKDTSGLLVIAKTLATHNLLTNAMKDREISREYAAITKGVITSSGTIRTQMGRHPTHRTKMSVLQSGGKPAVTHYTVVEPFPAHTYTHIKLETGRTHQIRVHMAHLYHPLAGDPVYGTHIAVPSNLSAPLKTALSQFKRQALHAMRLGFIHPITKEVMQWEAPLPDDMLLLLSLMRQEVDINE